MPRLDALFKLAKGNAHQLRSILCVDGDVIILAAHAIDGVDGDPDDAVGASQPELGFEPRTVFLARRGAKVPDNGLQLGHALARVADLELVSRFSQRTLQPVA